MKDAFFGLADRLSSALRNGETVLCYLSAERSDFDPARERQAAGVRHDQPL
jgi:hypothetical protein